MYIIKEWQSWTRTVPRIAKRRCLGRGKFRYSVVAYTEQQGLKRHRCSQKGRWNIVGFTNTGLLASSEKTNRKSLQCTFSSTFSYSQKRKQLQRLPNLRWEPNPKTGASKHAFPGAINVFTRAHEDGYILTYVYGRIIASRHGAPNP